MADLSGCRPLVPGQAAHRFRRRLAWVRARTLDSILATLRTGRRPTPSSAGTTTSSAAPMSWASSPTKRPSGSWSAPRSWSGTTSGRSSMPPICLATPWPSFSIHPRLQNASQLDTKRQLCWTRAPSPLDSSTRLAGHGRQPGRRCQPDHPVSTGKFLSFTLRIDSPFRGSLMLL